MKPSPIEKAVPACRAEDHTPSRLLVHMCCGPCSIIPLKSALSARTDVRGFFYNPNIHPAAEFKRRLDAVKTLASHMSIGLICDEVYSPAAFIKGLKAAGNGARSPEREARCPFCYSERLEATAKAAVEHGFDAFTTALLYSKFQFHDEIRRIGVDLGKKYGILFYYKDFRVGWQEGIDAAVGMGLYRQRYCGCVYSMMERDAKKKKATV